MLSSSILTKLKMPLYPTFNFNLNTNYYLQMITHLNQNNAAFFCRQPLFDINKRHKVNSYFLEGIEYHSS